MQKLVVLEEGADLDALSCAYGVLLLYKDAVLLKPSHLSRRASEVFKRFSSLFRTVEEAPQSFELVLVDSHNYEELLEVYGERVKGIIIYDHHPKAPEGFKGKVGFTGSCSTLVVEELIKEGVEIDAKSATLLALGIYEDTGMLTYEGTTPRDARALAWLLEKGADLRLIRQLLTEGLTKEHIDFLSRHLLSLESFFIDGKKISIALLKAEDYKPELLSLIYELKEVRDSCAFFVITEAGDKTYVFGRSLKGAYDVGAVLEAFGGGGHEFAGAVKLEGVSGERVKELIERFIKKEPVPIKVKDIMSSPPFLLHEDMDIQSALSELSQRNFAGAPVVDQRGELVGVVYKKALLRALKHGMTGKLKDFMVEDFHTLSPEDFIWEAEKLLSRFGEKLLPVVEGYKVVGVVTRLDLLHAYKKTVEDLKAYQKSIRLPEDVKPLLEQVGKIAVELGAKAYLVGGVVRDLLLGKKVWDLDFVVEGPAIEVAKRLAEAYGVDLHPFPEFGTAHLRIEDYKIEFATTRRETYPHPGSYPQVEFASLKEDLLRRDFTINAMAVSVNPQDFGTLIDYFGGLRDLRDGIIRVLHPLSFVEDPVRILRALRFAGRFDFKLSKSTQKLLIQAVESSMLQKAPKGRLYNELRLALREENFYSILKLYRKYGVLNRLIPEFRESPALWERLDMLREVINWHKVEFPQEKVDYGWLLFLLLLSPMSEEKGLELLQGMSAPSWVREVFMLLKRELHRLREELSKAEKNSQIYRLLKGKPLAFLLLLMTYERERVKTYLEKLRFVKADVSKFKGLEGKALGRAIEEEKERIMDSL